jgi:Domain of unknown function (DUF6431)
MLTVGKDGREVERKLRAGRLSCPLCGGRLAPWSHGRARLVFGAGTLRWRLRPRRARCAQCRVTHVLLPASVLARRRDEAGVIGTALRLAAGGVSCAAIARLLGRAVGLVRSWIGRLAGRAGQVRAVFTVLVVALDPDPPPIGPAGSPLGDAVAAITAAAAAFGRRFLVVVSPWELASAVTSGSLLAPVITAVPGNTKHVL